jgi:hypothetical protein
MDFLKAGKSNFEPRRGLADVSLKIQFLKPQIFYLRIKIKYHQQDPFRNLFFS